MALTHATGEVALDRTLAIRPWVAWALILLAIGAVYAMLVRQGHVWDDDFSMYVLHARNIAEGRAYADTPYIYNPDNAFLGPPSYPPIAPLLLAPVYFFVGFDLVAMKAVMVGSFLVSLVFCTLCFRNRLSAQYMAVLLVLVGLNIFYLREMAQITSDVPFLMFLYLSLWLIERANDAAEKTPRVSLGLATGAVVYLAFGTRTVGGVLLPALWLADLVRWRRPSRAAVAATVSFAVLAALQHWLIPAVSGGYADQLKFEPLTLLHNGALYASRLVAFWSNGYWKPLAALVCLLFTALAALGYYRSIRQRVTVLEIFPVLYLGVILLFPSYQGERFLLPVLPLYVFYALVGLESPQLASATAVRRWLAPAAIGMALLTSVARVTALDFGPIAEGPHRAESQALFEFIREHTGRDDVVVFAKPRALALYTSRRAATFHRAASDRELWNFIDRIHARYLVSFAGDRPLADSGEQAMSQYFREFIDRNQDRLREVYENPNFHVYKVRDYRNPTDAEPSQKLSNPNLVHLSRTKP
jgi:hypothetical protein